MPEEKFTELVKIMALLRSPQGCPWDREQTHDSIKGHLVEEAFEVIDALDRRDFNEFKEELGDLLLQVVFHAEMAAESGLFTIEDVINEIIVKLKRRHPHIFGEAKLETSAEVLGQWEKIKATEKERPSFLTGVPESLPALAYAQKMQEKAARVGFDWEFREDILEKLAEEIAEFFAAGRQTREMEEEFGDILFTLVNLARRHGLDAELALRRVSGKFRARFVKMEATARRQGKDFAEMTLAEKDSLWKLAKEELDDEHRGD